ncbi:MAG TPA: GNAT family N-acetyltransferase [Haloplasmataceae bacterium]
MFEVMDNRINLIIDNEIVGYIIYDEEKDCIVGSYIYVNPEKRGKGLSSKLIQKFVELSKEKKKKILPTCPVIKQVLESLYKDVLYDNLNK